MIWTLLLADAIGLAAIAPEEFRQKVALRHMCITDEIMADTGYRELGLLYIDRGENLPNIALTRSGERPALFERGFVIDASGGQSDDGSLVKANLSGEREGKPATMIISIARKKMDGTAVTVSLTQHGRVRDYRCFPDIRREQKQ